MPTAFATRWQNKTIVPQGCTGIDRYSEYKE